MSTLSESISGIQQAKSQLYEEKKKLEAAKKEAQAIKVPARTLQFQQQYIRTGKVPIGKVEQFIASQKQRKAVAMQRIGLASTALGKYEEEITSQEKELIKAQRYEEGYNLALEDAAAGRSTYLGGEHDPDLVRGYLEARKNIAKEQARYGGPIAAVKYGTPEEAQRAKLLLNIPNASQAMNLKWSDNYKKLTYELPSGARVEVGTSGVNKVEDIKTGMKYDNLESFNQAKMMEAENPAIDVRTGKPFGEVRPLSKENLKLFGLGIPYTSELSFYKQRSSKFYTEAEKEFEPMGLIAQGFGGITSFAQGLILEPFFKYGRREEDISIGGKIYRGGLMFGKTSLLFSNPITGVATSTYFGGKALSEFGKSPLGFFQETISYAVKEPFEFTGAISGIKAGPKAWDISRTALKTEIPKQSLIPKDVLTGKTEFPLSSKNPQIQLELFKKESYRLPGQQEPLGFHASPTPIKELTIKSSKSEFPGLYVSYGVSPHFLELKKSPISSNIKGLLKQDFLTSIEQSIKSRWGKPSVSAISELDFIIGKKGKPGQAYIPGIKKEVEAVISPGTILEPMESKFFFKYEGRRVPIIQYRARTSRINVGYRAEDIISGSYLPKKYKYSSQEILGSSFKYYSKYKISSKTYLPGSILSPLAYKYSSSKVSTLKSKYSPIISSSINKYNIYRYDSSKISLIPYNYNYKSKLYPKYYMQSPLHNLNKRYSNFRYKSSKIKNKMLRIKKSIRYKYTPSLTAGILKITARRKPGTFLGKETYFAGIRPIIR